ncbi:proline iminopeptidase-family hydrolase [Streptomyces sp. NPDC005953]|uniref:proline iminopeptidase-family hydrolase n=1 Tax=Streptomyces sp. NPDC005953 TaxID=3156719 RepID=UPI003404CA1A
MDSARGHRENQISTVDDFDREGIGVHHVEEGSVEFDGHRTYYRVTTDARSKGRSARPLVVVHGGPGCTHDYLLNLTDLVSPDRSVIHYDQLGNGRSTHLPDRSDEFWTVELFLRELDRLLETLGVTDYDLLGQSWGGMLAAEHAVRRPAGLRRLVIANSPASMELWSAEAARLRAALPRAVQETLAAHEEAGTTNSPAYGEASAEYYRRHVCRVDPQPAEVARTFEWIATDPTVYHTMNGPTEFHVVGTLRGWSIVDRLPAVAVPTLVINGAFDEAGDDTVRPFVERIPNARWIRFDASSHMPHIEERRAYMAAVADFLN